MPAFTDPWPAPTRRGPVDAVVEIPGSKSQTNRALVLAALGDGPSTVRGTPGARDTFLMVAALRALGVRCEERPGRGEGNADWHIVPGPLRGGTSVDVGLAGTVMRFVPPMAALAHGQVDFDGDPRARERPLGPLVSALRDLGVAVVDTDGFLPMAVLGEGHVPGGEVRIDASTSSQFISGLLLSGARFDDGLQVTHIGAHLPSQPHIDMTTSMLAEHGVVVRRSGTPEHPTWHLPSSPIIAVDRSIEPDLSNAAPFLAAALVTEGRVRIPHWPERTTQAGDHLRSLLAAMGAEVILDGTGLSVSAGGPLIGIDVDLHAVGELTPVLAALCALATTPSRLSGIGHLRGHETDRLAALAEMINSLGGDVRASSDALHISPRPLHGGIVDSYSDHRMATAAAVLGLAVPGIAITDVATTSKTLPDFPGMWERMLETQG